MSQLFLKTLNMSISAGWLILAVLVLRPVLKKAPKWARLLLWGIVALRLLSPVSLESALSLIPSAETVSPGIMLDWTPEISTGIGAVDAAVNPILTEAFAPEPWASANPLQIWITIAGNLWLLGVLVMLVYMAGSYWRLRRRVATAVRLRDNIFQSEYAGSPCVLGILRPNIYLPYHLEAGSLAHVIAHEKTHIRHKDHWWKLLGFVLLSVHWFNPLVWLSYGLLCRDMELACDESVIQKLDRSSQADYAQALVACSVSHSRIAACPLAFGEVGVKARVKSVLHYKKPGFWLLLAALVICAVVAVCFLTNPVTSIRNPGMQAYVPGTENTITTKVGYELQPKGNMRAKILEIWDNCYLVEPIEGSWELSSADRIIVPMENMEPSPEPGVGNIIEIHYDGCLMESYPAQIAQVYHIAVIHPASRQE